MIAWLHHLLNTPMRQLGVWDWFAAVGLLLAIVFVMLVAGGWFEVLSLRLWRRRRRRGGGGI